MAQAGFTPIQLYYSTTASAVPTAGNLASGELAINISDGKLYYKNASNVVTLLATAGTVSSQWVTSGSDIYYNTGNVGIGTTSPGYKLSVWGASGTAVMNLVETGVRSWAIRAGGAATNTFDIADLTAGATRLTLDSSGSIGIGTSTPGSKLEVNQGIITINSTDQSVTRLQLKTTGTGGRTYEIVGGLPGANNSQLSFYDATAAATRMTIDSSGNVGIGATSPQNLLHLASSAPAIRLEDTSGDAYALIDCDSPDEGTIRISADPGNTGANSIIAFRTDGAERARISAVGGFSVGTTSDPGAGAIYATGNITAYFSDNRLKTRLGGIENALDKVEKLSGFYYEANETAQALGYKPKREVGVSAQEVQAVLPEVVSPAPVDQQYLTVDYERLVPLLIEAIKELRAEVRALKGV